jgi:hypothetical protein
MSASGGMEHDFHAAFPLSGLSIRRSTRLSAAGIAAYTAKPNGSTAQFVIVGWSAPKGSRPYPGAPQRAQMERP